ncbi:MAG: hypothetical protein AB1758_20105 [Candidatus Eremiobacterota bacterium]
MKLRTTLAALVLGMLGALVIGAPAARAEANWDAVKKKVESAKDYFVNYDYESTKKGKFKFEYAYVSPGKIRTKILRGSDKNVGTVIVYDVDKDPKHVIARVGTGQLVRGLDHADVKGTSFYQSVYGLILSDVKSGKPVTKAGENIRGQATTLFEFNVGAGGTYRIYANDNNEILRSEKLEGGRVVEKRDFTKIEWNVNPKTDF